MTSSNIFPTAPVSQALVPYNFTTTPYVLNTLKPRWLLLALKFGENGLHATSKRRGTQKVEWADVGAFTVSHVEAIIKRYQPLTWRLLNRIAGDKDVDGAPAVCAHVIANLDFARNVTACSHLLGVFSPSHTLLQLTSWLKVVVSAICRPTRPCRMHALKSLANHEAIITKAQARFDETKVPSNRQCTKLHMDAGPSNRKRQKDEYWDCRNVLQTGRCKFSAVDLDKRQKLVLEDKRSKLINNLLSLIDQKYLDPAFSLHWHRVLVNSVPELSKWKGHVTMLFHEKASKLQLPIKSTKLYPLASSGKNETVTTERKDAFFDFSDQMGQTESDYIPRVLFAGRDGLTFQTMLEIERYLQFHGDYSGASSCSSRCQLSLWHKLKWTDVSRIFEVHWDFLLSPDPSSLGHSTAKINRAAHSILKKVDYYPAADLAFLVLDVRILNCWQNHFQCDDIFAHFANLRTLPDIEDLIKAARTLHCSFLSTRAIYHALDDTTIESEWSKNVPCGSAWVPPPVFESSQSEVKKRLKKEKPTTSHPRGDRVLANSITFMRDALMSREMSYAIAEGDPGRVYEVMKTSLLHS